MSPGGLEDKRPGDDPSEYVRGRKGFQVYVASLSGVDELGRFTQSSKVFLR